MARKPKLGVLVPLKALGAIVVLLAAFLTFLLVLALGLHLLLA